MHRKRLLCWKAYLPRSSWPTQPMTPIICARPSLPKARSPSSPTTRHGRSNIRSTSISMPSAISWSAASQNSNNSAASQPASKRQPEITLPSSLSQPSSYGCDKCPHHLGCHSGSAPKRRAREGRQQILLQRRVAAGALLREVHLGDGDQDFSARFQVGRLKHCLFFRRPVGRHHRQRVDQCLIGGAFDAFPVN